jgi:Glucosamine 6-phosphate synthetase, contains amidotransferase and phosphosugar isomerase domains
LGQNIFLNFPLKRGLWEWNFKRNFKEKFRLRKIHKVNWKFFYKEKYSRVSSHPKRGKGLNFLEKGFSIPKAFEGALKFKEFIYVHAKGIQAEK